ncbi:MAG: YggT family protein [Micrococcales bacterium]|nr:YggT family protein [Micrococcales bacterium]NBR60347.1 YggT family protein [Actinomycetota bacterium]NBR54408.1 YggT family protein [Micrococcales bacterium]NBT46244.1 YggT family protein [Actinomycetota bacterium]NBY43516.1 YggT family protein [Micrococcales bacterium]
MIYLILGLFALIQLFQILLVARIVLDWVRALSPGYRPNRLVLLVSAIAYGSTDWIVKPLGKLIRPIRLGSVYLDLSILVCFLLIGLFQRLLSGIPT